MTDDCSQLTVNFGNSLLELKKATRLSSQTGTNQPRTGKTENVYIQTVPDGKKLVTRVSCVQQPFLQSFSNFCAFTRLSSAHKTFVPSSAKDFGEYMLRLWCFDVRALCFHQNNVLFLHSLLHIRVIMFGHQKVLILLFSCLKK